MDSGLQREALVHVGYFYLICPVVKVAEAYVWNQVLLPVEVLLLDQLLELVEGEQPLLYSGFCGGLEDGALGGLLNGRC